MAWLARKAFYPSRLPFKLLHVDTGHNFPEADLPRLVRAGNRRGSRRRQRAEVHRRRPCRRRKTPQRPRNKLQTVTLLDTIEEHQFDACLGGGRRDEEKARARNASSRIATNSASGTEEPAPRALEHLQRPQTLRRALPRLPAQQLDRDGHLANTSARKTSRSPASTSATSARSSSVTASSSPSDSMTNAATRSSPCSTRKNPA